MKPNKKNLKPYGITALIALVIAVAVARGQGLTWPQAAPLMCRYLSDGFFVSGLLITGLGGLVWVSTTGFFDIFSYGFKSLLVLFSPLRKPHEHEKFYEYKLAKDAKRGKPLYFLLIVGLACLAISVLCLILYYNLPA